jgi:thioredoxin reductase
VSRALPATFKNKHGFKLRQGTWQAGVVGPGPARLIWAVAIQTFGKNVTLKFTTHIFSSEADHINHR